MIVVLAGTQQEAILWCRKHNHKPFSTTVRYIGSPQSLVGMRFHDGDRIVMLPGFEKRRDRQTILRALEQLAKVSRVSTTIEHAAL